MHLTVARARPPAVSPASVAGLFVVGLLAAFVPARVRSAEAGAKPGDASEAPVAPAEAPTVPALEKRLKQAVASSSVAEASAALDELGAIGSAEAAEAAIKTALKGTSYPIERQAVGMLVRLEDPKARAKIREQARKNPDFKTRIILNAVLAQLASEPASLDALHGCLKDPSKPVLLSTVYWLRQLKKKESVDPLIEAMEARERKGLLDRVYYDIQKALGEITGFDIESAGEWKGFWEAQKKGLSAPAKTSGGGRTAVARRSKFFSVMLDSDRILFVIDISGSMTVRDPYEGPAVPDDSERGKTVVGKGAGQGKTKAGEIPASRERIARVKAELIRCIQGLQPPTRFGVIAFNHELSSLWDSRALRDANPAAKSQAVAWVKALQANGATRTDLAMREALSIPDVDCIVVLTDGAPKDEKDKRLDIEPILRMVKEQNRFLRARIQTISFQQIRDTRMRRFVQELSIQNDGGEPHLLP